MSLPSTATSSHAREFDLERRIPLQGSVEMNGPDGEGVNVSLSLSSRAYGSVTANEPLGSLLPHSLSISSGHYNQVTLLPLVERWLFLGFSLLCILPIFNLIILKFNLQVAITTVTFLYFKVVQLVLMI